MKGLETLPPPKVDARPEGYIGPARSLEKLVDSRMFITFARVMMILASVVGLPVAGYVLKRGVETADRAITKLDDLSLSNKLLEQAVKQGFDTTKDSLKRVESDLQDHESRIRVLERMPPAMPVTPVPPPDFPTSPHQRPLTRGQR